MVFRLCGHGAQESCAPTWKSEEPAGMPAIMFREVGVGLYFFDLVGVAFGVGGDEKDPIRKHPLRVPRGLSAWRDRGDRECL